jgi:hypothetical protein
MKFLTICFALTNLIFADLSCQKDIDAYLMKYKQLNTAFVTQEMTLNYRSLSRDYIKLTKEDVLCYISNDSNAIGYQYTNYNMDNPKDSVTGFGNFTYYGLYTKKMEEYFFNIFVKTQFDDSTMIYLQILNNNGVLLQQLLLHKICGEEPYYKAFIDSSFNIIVGLYSPLNGKTSISLTKYKLMDQSMLLGKVGFRNIIVEGFYLDFLAKTRQENDPMFTENSE